MKAQVGDRLVVESHQVGTPRRIALIIKTEHPDGSPPYWVKWFDDGHEGLFFPGPDCHVEPKSSATAQHRSGVHNG